MFDIADEPSESRHNLARVPDKGSRPYKEYGAEYLGDEGGVASLVDELGQEREADTFGVLGIRQRLLHDSARHLRVTCATWCHTSWPGSSMSETKKALCAELDAVGGRQYFVVTLLQRGSSQLLRNILKNSSPRVSISQANGDGRVSHRSDGAQQLHPRHKTLWPVNTRCGLPLLFSRATRCLSPQCHQLLPRPW